MVERGIYIIYHLDSAPLPVTAHFKCRSARL
jgi:hypothetical protein